MQMFKKILLPLFFVPVVLSAQLTGTVLDARTHESLVGANIELIKAKKGTVADIDGFFIIESEMILYGDTMVISYLGYEDKVIPLDEYRNKSIIYMETTSLEEAGIEVTGERFNQARRDLPTTSQQITAREIETHVVGDINSVLRSISSVRIVGNEIEGSNIQIRGSNPDEVNVYVDGILLNSLDYNNKADMSLINTENIEKINVQKGGNMLLQGQGAAGGVVNIETKVPTRTAARALAIVGDYENHRYSFDFSLPLSSEFSLAYFGTYGQSRPELIYQSSTLNPDITNTYTIFNQKTMHDLSGYYLSNSGKLTAKLISFNSSNDKDDWIRDREIYLAGGSYIGKILGTDYWRIVSNYNKILQKEERILDPNNSYLFDYDSDQFTFRAQKMIPIKMLNITAAYDYFHDRLENISSVKSDTLSSKLYDDYSWDNMHSFTAVLEMLDTTSQISDFNLSVFASYRHNWWVSGQNDYVTNFSLKAFRPMQDKRWEAFITFGRNVKYHTLLENAYAGNILSFGPDGEEFQSRLKPEYIASLEIGGRYIIRYPMPYVLKMQIDAAYFYNNIQNKIIQQPLDQSLMLVQEGENETRGYEASIRLIDVFSSVDVDIMHTSLSVSNPLVYAYRPLSETRLQLAYTPQIGIYSTVVLFHDGESLAWYYNENNDLVTDKISPFTDLDIIVGYRGKLGRLGFNLQLAGRNVLDNSEFQDYYVKRRYFQGSIILNY